MIPHLPIDSFGLALVPPQWHVALFGGIGLLFLALIFRAWHKKEGLGETIGTAVVCFTLFYLTSPYATDASRWWIGALIVPLMLIFVYRYRHAVWKPVFVASLAWLAFATLMLTSPSVNLYAFEGFVSKAVLFHIIGICAWLAIRVAFPRTRGAEQAMRAAGVIVVLSLVLFIVAATAWFEAADRHRVLEAPMVTSGEEIRAIAKQPWEERRLGFFTVGTIVGPERDRDGEESSAEAGYLAYFMRRAPGSVLSSSPETKFPSSFKLRLNDGSLITVAGIQSARQSFAWPESEVQVGQHGLHHGDAVVVWAEPSIEAASSEGGALPALVDTRVIAYGDFESFQRDFLGDLIRTSRLCGWIALAGLPLSVIPLVFGIRHLLRNRVLVSPHSTSAP